MSCGCKKFCESHGRNEIAVDADGTEYCNECAADGWRGELCSPSPNSCHPGDESANEFERAFMCQKHAEQHHKFSAECLTEAT